MSGQGRLTMSGQGRLTMSGQGRLTMLTMSGQGRLTMNGCQRVWRRLGPGVRLTPAAYRYRIPCPLMPWVLAQWGYRTR